MEEFMMAFITVSLLLVFFIVLLISIPWRVKYGDPEAADPRRLGGHRCSPCESCASTVDK